MDLLLSQKNQIFEIILKHSFEPNCFKWTTTHPKFASGLPVPCYKGKTYFFCFNIVSEDRIYTNDRNVFSPGEKGLIESTRYHDWSDQENNFAQWLVCLKRELSHKDPWEKIGEYLPKKEIHLDKEEIDSEFSYQEVLQIEKSLDVFRKKILKEYSLSKKQVTLVHEKLDYLCESAKRCRRVDWKNIFIGTMINVMITINLNPAQAYAFWKNLIISFTHLLSLK